MGNLKKGRYQVVRYWGFIFSLIASIAGLLLMVVLEVKDRIDHGV